MEAKIPSASPMPLFPWLSRSWWAKMQEACWVSFSTPWSLQRAIKFLGLTVFSYSHFYSFQIAQCFAHHWHSGLPREL